MHSRIPLAQKKLKMISDLRGKNLVPEERPAKPGFIAGIERGARHE
jgi:hypothetical protein